MNLKRAIIILILFFTSTGLFAEQPFLRALRSAAVPGWGEPSMGNKTGYVFLATEVALWSSMFYFRSESDLMIRKSHQHAFNNANLRSSGNIDDHTWFLMSRFNSSGFDVGGYNHSILIQAMDLYPHNADRRDEYIRAHMLDDNEIYWNWETRENRRVYQHMIRDSGHFDDYAKVVGGVIILNHVVSFLNTLRVANRANRREIDFFTAVDGDRTRWVCLRVGF